jgi:hypothetical protein
MTDKAKQPKQKVEPIETINIDGREATTVTGAIKILNRRAKEDFQQDRDYSRDAVYAMFVANKIEGIRTPSANYYFVDSLEKVPLSRHGKMKADRKRDYTRRVGKEGYPPEKREQATRLYREQHLSKRAIADELKVSYQTINNWLRNVERISADS